MSVLRNATFIKAALASDMRIGVEFSTGDTTIEYHFTRNPSELIPPPPAEDDSIVLVSGIKMTGGKFEKYEPPEPSTLDKLVLVNNVVCCMVKSIIGDAFHVCGVVIPVQEFIGDFIMSSVYPHISTKRFAQTKIVLYPKEWCPWVDDAATQKKKLQEAEKMIPVLQGLFETIRNLEHIEVLKREEERAKQRAQENAEAQRKADEMRKQRQTVDKMAELVNAMKAASISNDDMLKFIQKQIK